MNTTDTSYSPLTSILTGVVIGAASSFFSSINWSCLVFFAPLFGFYRYNITDNSVSKRVQKRVKYASMRSEDGRALDYICGPWFLGYINVIKWDTGDRCEISLLTTKSTYVSLTQEEKEDVGPEKEVEAIVKKSLTIWQRSGTYFNAYYRKRVVSLPTSLPHPGQQSILDAIVQHQKVHEHTVALVHGPPGTGKSMLGLLLAHNYNTSYCNTLKPWEPGSNLGDLYAEVEPTKENPLILAFDEIDSVLLAIHSGISPHKSLPIQVPNKQGWNHMLDEISRGMFPHLILLLTTNKEPAFINSLDSSYIREKRVNIIASLP